jgi:hypothetical protein
VDIDGAVFFVGQTPWMLHRILNFSRISSVETSLHFSFSVIHMDVDLRSRWYFSLNSLSSSLLFDDRHEWSSNPIGSYFSGATANHGRSPSLRPLNLIFPRLHLTQVSIPYGCAEWNSMS